MTQETMNSESSLSGTRALIFLNELVTSFETKRPDLTSEVLAVIDAFGMNSKEMWADAIQGYKPRAKKWGLAAPPKWADVAPSAEQKDRAAALASSRNVSPPASTMPPKPSALALENFPPETTPNSLSALAVEDDSATSL